MVGSLPHLISNGLEWEFDIQCEAIHRMEFQTKMYGSESVGDQHFLGKATMGLSNIWIFFSMDRCDSRDVNNSHYPSI